MKMIKQKKGVFNQLAALGVGLAALAITLVVVFLIFSNLAANSQVSADGNAAAAVTTLTDAAEDIPTWVSLVVIAVIGAILIGLVSIFRQR